MQYNNTRRSNIMQPKLPQLLRLNSADRDAAIKNLQETMAHGTETVKNNNRRGNQQQVPEPVATSQNTDTVVEQHSRKRLSFDFTSIIGRRMTQEDTEVAFQNAEFAIAAVFDGHGGEECSQFCARNFVDYFLNEQRNSANIKSALFQTMLRLDSSFQQLDYQTVGCTATCLVFDKTANKLYVSNVGDSKTLIGFTASNQLVSMAQVNRNATQSLQNYKNTRTVSNLSTTQSPQSQTSQISSQLVFQTQDHKPNSKEEQARIKKYFPSVRIITLMGIARLDGQLSLSRAIGDYYMKQSGIIPEPDLYEQDAELAQFVVLACDGLFDVFTVAEVDDMVRTMIAGRRISVHNTRQQYQDVALAYFEGKTADADRIMQGIAGQRVYRTNACSEVDPHASRPKRMSQVLTKMAYWKNSMDNVTVLIGLFE